MDGLNGRFFAKELLVGIHRNLEDGRIRIGAPAGIAVANFHFGSAQFEYSLHHITNIRLEGFARGALARFYADYTLLFHLDRGEVGRGFYKAFDAVAHAHHAVGAAVET